MNRLIIKPIRNNILQKTSSSSFFEILTMEQYEHGLKNAKTKIAYFFRFAS